MARRGADGGESRLRAAIVGPDVTVKAGREKLVGDAGADEVMVVTDTDEHEDRLRSYGRVAEIATVIEAKPIMAVKEGEEWTSRS